MNIQLKKIELNHFKGITEFTCDFEGKNSSIIGANGVGKTTIYEAYLWVLFGKLSSGTEDNVQPRDKNKEIIHHLVTSVFITLDVDGEERVFGRKQKEKWSRPTNTTEETLKGTEYEYFYQNRNVAITKTAFKKYVTEICDVDKWYCFSNIENFIRMNPNDRRNMLKSVASCKSDEEIAKDFPEIAEQFKKGVPIDDFAKDCRFVKNQAKARYDVMPDLMEECDKQRVNKDWDEYEKQATDLKKKIKAIDKELQGDVDGFHLEELNKANDELIALKQEKQNLVSSIEKVINEKNGQVIKIISGIENELKDVKREYEIQSSLKLTAEKKMNDTYAALVTKSNEYREIAAYPINVKTHCDVCGSPLNPESVERTRQSLQDRKEKKMIALSEEGEKLNAQYNAEVQEVEAFKAKIGDLTAKLNQKEQEFNNVKDANKMISLEESIISNPSVQEADKKIADKAAEIERIKEDARKNDKKSELKAKKENLEAELEGVNNILSEKKVNEHVEKEIKRLKEESKSCIAKMDEMDEKLNQYKAFKKARVEYIENAVSSLFVFTQFKMFEKNKSNEGEQDICEPYYNGVPYNEVNEAMKIAMGIDIVSGMMKAEDFTCPLFIDATERIAHVPESDCQQIRIKHVQETELTIINNL